MNCQLPPRTLELRLVGVPGLASVPMRFTVDGYRFTDEGQIELWRHVPDREHRDVTATFMADAVEVVGVGGDVVESSNGQMVREDGGLAPSAPLC